MGFDAGADLCLSFWSLAWDRGWIDFQPSARVLEIGCAEADWQTPMLALRPDLQITGLDWRPCERPGTTVQGDVMNPNMFPIKSFDAIVSVSAIEHVGLGAYDADPVDEVGDARAMFNAHRWLRPGGWMYLDVPYRLGAYEEHPNFRAYNNDAITGRLLPGFRLVKSARCDVNHPDGPYMAMLLEKV